MDTVSNVAGAVLVNIFATVSLFMFKSNVGMINSFVQECKLINVNWQHSMNALQIIKTRAKMLIILVALAGMVYVLNWHFAMQYMNNGKMRSK